MAFRDDREALRARAEVLEGQVSSLRDELDRARAELDVQEAKDQLDEAELERLRGEVEALRDRLGVAADAPKPKPKPSGAPPAIFGGLGILAAVFGVGLLFALGAREEVERAEPRPIQAVPPAVATEAAPEPRVTPLDAARFGAVVLSAEGTELAPGDGCVVEADLTGGGGVSRLRVFCDDLLYDSTTSGGTEMTAHDDELEGHERADGQHVYRLRWIDTGTRTGPRPQITVDTEAQAARIWRDVGRPFDVRLYVEDRSAARVGGPLGRTVTDTDLGSLHLRAEAIRRSGTTPDALDEGCELRGHGDREGPLGCRLMLRCGGAILYGADSSGYNRCRAVGDAAGAPPDIADDEGVTAEDSDPEVRLRTEERRFTVADERAGARWEAQLALSEDPRCELDGSWHGRVRTMTGESPGLRVVPESTGDGARAVIAPGLPSGLAEVELDCTTGTGALLLEDGTRYEGRFGPGFATFLGRVRGGTPAVFWLRRGAAPDTPLVVPGTPVQAAPRGAS